MGLAVFLASDSSSWITGTLIPMDGGNLAMNISLTAVNTVLSIVTLPLIANLALPLSSGQFEGLARYSAVLFPFPIWVASVAHISFGARVTMCRSCGVSARVQARCGDSSLCACIGRRTRLRLTRIASITRNRAQTLRWPSPTQGERSRSLRIAASKAASEIAGFGPGLCRGGGGDEGTAPVSWRRTA